jgi:hypothetical protein
VVRSCKQDYGPLYFIKDDKSRHQQTILTFSRMSVLHGVKLVIMGQYGISVQSNLSRFSDRAQRGPQKGHF